MTIPRRTALAAALAAASLPCAHAAPQESAPPARPAPDAWHVMAAGVRDGLPKADGPEAVVCTNAAEGDAWDAVAQKLATAQKAAVWRFPGRDFTALTERFRAEGPANVTFVLPPDTVEANFQWALLPWAAQLDADPFVDFNYGYVTGATPDEAMRFVKRLIKLRDTPMALRTLEFGPTTATSVRPWPVAGTRGLSNTKLSHHGVPDLLKHAAEFRGRGLVRFWGHGMPEGIVDSVQAADLKQLPFTNAVVFGGACYTGVVQRAYDRKYEKGKGLMLTARDLAPEESFCQSLLRRDVRAYLGALDPDHGISTLQETGYLYAHAASLGATMKHTYDLLALALRGEAWPTQPYVSGKPRGRITTSHIMMRGAASRVLFGDPGDRPLARPIADPTITTTWHDGHARLACRINKDNGIAPMFHLFHSGFQSKRLMNNKVRVVIDVPDGWDRVPTPKGAVLRNGDGPVPFTLPVAAVEMWRGTRRLHLQVQMPQGIAYKPGLQFDVIFSGDLPAAGAAAPAAPAAPARTKPAGGTAPGAPSVPAAPTAPGADQPQQVAVAAGEWLLANATKSEAGWSWAEYAGEPEHQASLYAGTAGTIVFFTNLYRATGDVRWKRAALQGARWLQSQAKATAQGPVWESTSTRGGRTITSRPEGLYTGTAGIAWVLAELGVVFKAPGLTATARRAADGLCARARRDEDGGCSWPATGTDIIAGNAGIGCALLELHRLLRRDSYLETARGAAIWLQGQAMTDGPHRKWSSHVGWTRHYPGFSHGTAGIVFFFVRLHRATNEARWLAAARAGGEWLAAHAHSDGDGCKWVHFEPAKDKPATTPAFRTGWCHGPAGTGFGLLALHTATGEPRWLELAERAAAWEARAVQLGSERPRFWSPSRCCGAAGITEYHLALYRHTGKAVHLDRARLAAQGLHRLARPDDDGMRWTNSARPDKDGKIYYGTSLQLGAAGEGLAFLGLAAAEAALEAAAKGRHVGAGPGPIELPDRRW